MPGARAQMCARGSTGNSYRGRVAPRGIADGVNFYPVEIYGIYVFLFFRVRDAGKKTKEKDKKKKRKGRTIYWTREKYVTGQLKCRPQDIPVFISMYFFS